MAVLYVFIYTNSVSWSKELVEETKRDVICISADDKRVREKLKDNKIKKVPLLFISKHIDGKSYTNIEYDVTKIRELVI